MCVRERLLGLLNVICLYRALKCRHHLENLDMHGRIKYHIPERSRARGPPLWSSGQSFWLQIQRSRVRFPALPDFLSSSGSGTGSTQSRELN